MTWEPKLLPPHVEQAMEAADVPESDRDEVRKYGEFLERYAAHKRGEKLSPAPEGMKAFLLGDDEPTGATP